MEDEEWKTIEPKFIFVSMKIQKYAPMALVHVDFINPCHSWYEKRDS